MMSSIEPQRIAVLTEALEKNVFNADFGIQGKKTDRDRRLFPRSGSGELFYRCDITRREVVA